MKSVFEWFRHRFKKWYQPDPTMEKRLKALAINVKVVSDSSIWAPATADLFITKAQTVIGMGNSLTVALSGGSTPRELYSRLVTPNLASRVKWGSVHLFWGDEHCVPPDHPDSNYCIVAETLLGRVPIPMNNIHRIHGEMVPD